VYSEERERPVLLVVDQRRSMFFGSRRAMKSVVAAELAALGAWRTLKTGDRVGGIVFNDDEIVELPAHRSQMRVMRLLQEVSRQNKLLADSPQTEIQPTPKVSLNDALRTALRYANHDHLVAVFSDLTGADEETKRLTTRLQAHNDVLIVAIYDPLGASLRSLPGMTAVSGEERVELPLGTDFENAFQDAFSELLDHWTTIFRALRIPVMPISTAFNVADQLRELFGQRAPI
jgi:uncharacterized protein (DUF58 family)